jgi:hypothetical protein
MISGYLEVGKQRIFYVHVPCRNKCTNDSPLVLWTQGGPGGSSEIGLFAESMFRVNSATDVQYSTPTLIEEGVSYVYLDNPACVGFSYSLDLADCNTSDTKANAALHAALQQFRTKEFPQYAEKPFWLAGESWSGMYSTFLGATVSEDPVMQPYFAGILLGNPVMMCYDDTNDPLEYAVGDVWTDFNTYYWQGFVDQQTYEAWRAAGCESEEHRRGTVIQACYDLYNQVTSQDNLGVDFDPDNLWADYCTGNGTMDFASSQCGAPNSTDSGQNSAVFYKIGQYLAQSEVKEAMHGEIDWNSYQTHFNYTHDVGSTLKFYRTIMKNAPNAKILVYSGTGDVGTVPWTYSTPCIYRLFGDEKPSTPWTSYYVNHHRSGHFVQWANGQFTFATVKGGAHETPLSNPLQMTELRTRFIANGSPADPSVTVVPATTKVPEVGAVYSSRALLSRFIKKWN